MQAHVTHNQLLEQVCGDTETSRWSARTTPASKPLTDVGRTVKQQLKHIATFTLIIIVIMLRIEPKHQRHRPRAPMERQQEGALHHHVCTHYAHPKPFQGKAAMILDTNNLTEPQASSDTNRFTFTSASVIDNKLRNFAAQPDKALIITKYNNSN